MGYEYKEMLKVAARDFLTGNLQQDSETGEYLNLGEVEENYSDISIELEHVYAQSAKADEYEAKAFAFDETIEILKELRDFSKKTKPHSQRMKVKRRNYVQFCDEVLREIKLTYEEIKDEYESGEPFAKK